MAAVPALCFSCAYYSEREKACTKFIVLPSKTGVSTEPHFEKAASVRLDSTRCGSEANLYVARIGLHVVASPQTLCK